MEWAVIYMVGSGVIALGVLGFVIREMGKMARTCAVCMHEHTGASVCAIRKYGTSDLCECDGKWSR